MSDNASHPASAATTAAAATAQIPPDSRFDIALERNRKFAEERGHEQAKLLPTLGLFVIGCLDPRVDPAYILGLELSDAMVVRNVGGRVTPEVINDIAFLSQMAETIIPDGPLFEVAVIHHTQCGAGALANDEFRDRYAARIGVEPETLRGRAIIDPVATVRHDVGLIQASSAVSPRISVSGHVYDVTTGLIETVVSKTPQPAEGES